MKSVVYIMANWISIFPGDKFYGKSSIIIVQIKFASFSFFLKQYLISSISFSIVVTLVALQCFISMNVSLIWYWSFYLGKFIPNTLYVYKYMSVCTFTACIILLAV